MFMSDYIMYFSVINCLIFIALCIIIIYCLFLVRCVFFVVIWIRIFGVLTPLSAIFQLYHGEQFTKQGANPCHIGDRLVWAVRSNDLTHWTTRDLFFPFFVVCFCLITLCIIIIYCLFLITVVQMQRKPRAGANRTITHSHTYYTCEITTFSKLNAYTV